MSKEIRKAYYSTLANSITKDGYIPSNHVLTMIVKDFPPAEPGALDLDNMWGDRKEPFYDKIWTAFWYRFVKDIIWNKVLDRRSWKFLFQRVFRGWDDSETWSLDYTFYKWALPRFKRFRVLMETRHPSVPSGLVSENNTWDLSGSKDWKDDPDWKEWQRILGEIEWALAFGNYEDKDSCDDWCWLRHQNGLNLFSAHLNSIWW
jgi:hypothetical protein